MGGNQTFSLADKRALVTGAGSGIGRAVAHLFSEKGAFVWVADRNEDAGGRVVQEILGLGGKAKMISVDVSNPAEVSQLVESIPEVDILVNNAGIGHVGGLLTTNVNDLERLNAVNVIGPFNLCKTFVPAMLRRGTGAVINMASIGGVLGVRDRLAYTMTKHAVVGLTRSLALDYSHTGVRFNAICPGRVETPFVRERVAESADPAATYKEMASTQLNGRMARPDEIAAAALFLASDESSMISGCTLLIDGGWSVGK